MAQIHQNSVFKDKTAVYICAYNAEIYLENLCSTPHLIVFAILLITSGEVWDDAVEHFDP